MTNIRYYHIIVWSKRVLVAYNLMVIFSLFHETSIHYHSYLEDSPILIKKKVSKWLPNCEWVKYSLSICFLWVFFRLCIPLITVFIMKCCNTFLKEMPLDKTYYYFEYRTKIDCLSSSLWILNFIIYIIIFTTQFMGKC